MQSDCLAAAAAAAACAGGGCNKRRRTAGGNISCRQTPFCTHQIKTRQMNEYARQQTAA